MVMLQCGIRLYLKVDSQFTLLHHHLPPIFANTNRRVADPKEHHKPVELTHALSIGSTVIFNLKEEADNHTFIVWKYDESRESENCS